VSCLIYTSFPTEEHLPEDSKTGACCNLNTFSIFHSIPQYLLHTVKGARGKVSFDSQNDKWASQYPVKLHLRRICHISFTKWQMRFTVTLNDKYASGEASQDNCEAYLSFCESNDTLPRVPFTVYTQGFSPNSQDKIVKTYFFRWCSLVSGIHMLAKIMFIYRYH
jgi:hypothetical protein